MPKKAFKDCPIGYVRNPETRRCRKDCTRSPNTGRCLKNARDAVDEPPKRKSSSPKKSPKRKSSSPKKSPKRKSSSPKKSPKRKSSSPKKSPKRKSSSPKKSPKRKSSSPKKSDRKSKSLIKSTPKQKSLPEWTKYEKIIIDSIRRAGKLPRRTLTLSSINTPGTIAAVTYGFRKKSTIKKIKRLMIIDTNMVPAIMDLIRQLTLEAIIISGTGLSIESLEDLLREKRTIKELYLDNNNLSDYKTTELFKMIERNDTLEQFTMDRNKYHLNDLANLLRVNTSLLFVETVSCWNVGGDLSNLVDVLVDGHGHKRAELSLKGNIFDNQYGRNDKKFSKFSKLLRNVGYKLDMTAVGYDLEKYVGFRSEFFEDLHREEHFGSTTNSSIPKPNENELNADEMILFKKHGLDVSDLNSEKIKKLYRNLQLKTHPDKGGNDVEFKEMQNLYQKRYQFAKSRKSIRKRKN